jgi:ubiquinone/menaquinone biosynthesis C-methylase UbiE
MQPYEYQTMRSVEDSYWWYTGLRTRVVDSLKRVADTGKTIRVLDAGCGTGGMMQTLHQHFPGADIIGIDFSAQAVQSTRERDVGTVVNASVDAVPFGREIFDVIISLDVVLEMKAVHDCEALAEFHRVLKKQALLILNVTAFECLRGQHDDAVTVKHRYIKKTLAPILLNAGFTIVKMMYWNALFFPLLVIWRPLSRLFADTAQPVSDLALLPGWLNNMMTWISLKEMRLARTISPPCGSSIFVLAKKN